MSVPIYLDHAATTPVRREVLEAMFPYFQQAYGNPSSVHSLGLNASTALAQAREDIAWILHSSSGEIVFTSGGTEADNLAVIGGAEANRDRGDHIVISAVEHDAVFQSAQALTNRGFRVTVAPVDAWGRVDPQSIAELVTESTILVSCMYANNEIGTVEPVRQIGEAIHARNACVLIHTDAVQAAGALSLDVSALGVDLLSLSAHKIYGPRGAGVLYVRRGARLDPLLHGGEQERNRRPGTENLPAITGMAMALLLAEEDRKAESSRLTALRDVLIPGVLARVPDAHLTGHPIERLPGHASFHLADRSGESLLVDLDIRGILCSTGSACHAGKTDPSRVLLALGLSPSEARNGIRMTLGRETTADDIDSVLVTLRNLFAASPGSPTAGPAHAVPSH